MDEIAKISNNPSLIACLIEQVENIIEAALIEAPEVMEIACSFYLVGYSYCRSNGMVFLIYEGRYQVKTSYQCGSIGVGCCTIMRACRYF